MVVVVGQVMTKALLEHSKVTAVVLAAGLSQRMGDKNKLLLLINNEPMLLRTVSMLCKCNLKEVIVVTGHEHKKVKAVLEGLDVRCVFNADYEQGQATSVQCGLEAVVSPTEGVLICLADQPAVGESEIARLIDAFNQRDDKEIVIPRYQGQRGNPIIISTAIRLRVLNNDEGFGCRHYIDTHPKSVKWIDVDNPAFVTDVDTQTEYRRFCGKNTL